MSLSAASVFAACTSERSLQDCVIPHAQFRGWKVIHIRPARTRTGWVTPVQGDGKGFPDNLMIRRDRGLVAELKRVGEKPDAYQLAWLEAFAAAGWETYVWTPADANEIARVLS